MQRPGCFVSGPPFRSRSATVDHDDHSEPLAFWICPQQVRVHVRHEAVGGHPFDQYAFAGLTIPDALLYPTTSQLQSLLGDACLAFSFFQFRI